tara:strand:- start:67654 stop:68001 length:348 start_codon:yes stop_codon:yes gene_type:complete
MIDTRPMNQQIAAYRSELIGAITRLIKPCLRPTGYARPGPKHPAEMCIWRATSEFALKCPIIRTFTADMEIQGFTKAGVIVDHFVGIVVREYGEMSIEQLILLCDFMSDKAEGLG